MTMKNIHHMSMVLTIPPGCPQNKTTVFIFEICFTGKAVLSKSVIYYI